MLKNQVLKPGVKGAGTPSQPEIVVSLQLGTPPTPGHHHTHGQSPSIPKQTSKPKTKRTKRARRVRRPRSTQPNNPAGTVTSAIQRRTAAPRRVRKPRVARARALRAPFKLTPCAYDYFRVLYNPFDVNIMPCIPGMIPTPTHKFKVTTRGSFQVGTSGCGGIAFWPGRMISRTLIPSYGGDTIAPAIITTTAAYAGIDYSFTNSKWVSVPVAPELAVYPGITSTYEVATLGGYTGPAGLRTDSFRSAKLVGAGVRVQYVDKVLDMSGDYVVWRNPNPTSTLPASGDNLADLLAVNAACLTRVGEGYCGVSYLPLLEADLAALPEPGKAPYDTVIAPTETNWTNRLAGGVFITNAQPGQRYAFEAIAFFELSGKAVPVTASHSDPSALGAILSINTPTVVPDMPKAESTAFRMLKETVGSMGYAGLQVLGAIATEAVFQGARSLMG